MMITVLECEEAMKNVNIDDATLVRMFHQCYPREQLVVHAVRRNDERMLRLLIDANFMEHILCVSISMGCCRTDFKMCIQCVMPDE
jgi:hypothetical protein